MLGKAEDPRIWFPVFVIMEDSAELTILELDSEIFESDRLRRFVRAHSCLLLCVVECSPLLVVSHFLRPFVTPRGKVKNSAKKMG